MSIASEITRINNNIAAAYTALDGKGATLPETQNSANLADTIDTISAGGGSQTVTEDGWVRPDVFQTVDDVVLSYDETDEFNQWEVLNTGTYDVTHIFGYVLSDYIPDVIYIQVGKSCNCSYQASEGTLALVSSGSSYDYYSYTFSGTEKWLVFACRYGSSVSINLSTSSAASTFLETSSFLASVMPRYKHIRKLGTQYVMTNIDTDGSWNDVCYLLPLYQDYEDFTLTNIKFGGAIAPNCYISICQRIHNGTKFLSYFTDESYITATGATGYFPANYVDALGLCNIMPFAIDLSSFSSALTISGDAKVHCRLKELFIKIPAQNFQFGNTTNAKDVLTKESWQYIANNAPTVSSKTFNIGSHNIAVMGGTSSTIYTTLTGKGWTVS